MKRILTALALTVLTSTSAFAHSWEHGGYRGGYHEYRGGGYNWVAPAIIGGVIGYELAQPRVIVQQPQVIYQQPPVVYQQYPAPVAPYGYHYEAILDAHCNCYRNVLVQN